MVASVSRQQVSEIGLALGAVGAVLVASGAIHALGRYATKVRERRLTMVGALIVAVAFLVQILSYHVTSPVAPSPTSSPTPSSTSSASP